MDGLDIVHIHWTQEHPEAPLKMEILHYGEVPFEGQLKGTYVRMVDRASSAYFYNVLIADRDSPADH